MRILKGDPTEEELAALVAVVGSRRSTSGDAKAAVRRSAWSAPEYRLRGGPRPFGGRAT